MIRRLAGLTIAFALCLSSAFAGGPWRRSTAWSGCLATETLASVCDHSANADAGTGTFSVHAAASSLAGIVPGRQFAYGLGGFESSGTTTSASNRLHVTATILIDEATRSVDHPLPIGDTDATTFVRLSFVKYSCPGCCPQGCPVNAASEKEVSNGFSGTLEISADVTSDEMIPPGDYLIEVDVAALAWLNNAEELGSGAAAASMRGTAISVSVTAAQ